ncbi:MAG TPA: ATP-binding protein [Cellvibrio sp.]|nr:ATP-binding protein [Cellvibrio sp.]
MPFTPKSFKRNVWQLIFIPVFVLIVVLSVSLTCFYLYEINRFVDLRGNAIAKKTAQLIHNPHIQQNKALLQTLLDNSLEDPYVRAIHVQLNNSGEFIHSGPEFMLEPEAAPAPDGTKPMRRNASRSILFSHPISDSQGENNIGWVEIEMLSSPYMVIHYQTILISIAVSLLCIMIGASIATRLLKAITEPLRHIKQVINKIAKGELQTRVKPQDSGEFIDIASAINEMATSLENAQQDLQNHIEQSTQDLIETLETIEIKNIELDLARKEAIEGSRVKSEFLANTSHEIRTPLNGILGFVALALKTDMDEQQADYLNTIRSSAENLLTVINGILDFSKLEAGKLTLDYAPLPLRQTIDETLHILAPDAHEKNLQLIAQVDSDVPGNLLGDSLRFKQVLSNLVSNAIKFSDQGNILVRVKTIAAKETNLMLKISVSDQGKGLNQTELEQLFKPFFQTDSSNTREQGGTGLGLAICKGLVARMNGEIGVDSQPDQGSTFWFTLRLGIDKKQASPVPAINLKNHRVLIWSNNGDTLEQLQTLLHEWKMEQEILNELHDVFPVIRQAHTSHPYSLLIIDVAPGERKIQPMLLHSINEQLSDEFNCKTIVCCTSAQQRFFRSGSHNSHTTFLNKPIAYDGLLKALCKKLNISASENRSEQAIEARNQAPSVSVLLVDDNPANLQLASELLRGLNTHVVQANNGLQAIESCKNNVFDVIFMDIQMPGMDGLEATQHIRDIEGEARRTPIIALTAHSLTNQKSQLLIAGMDDCISKPVNEAQLAHTINRWACLSGKRELVIQDEIQDLPELPAPTSSEKEENSSVNIALCLKLANNKPALARDMLQMMLVNLPDEKADINQAIADKDMDTLSELIHRLYGSCCYCGVPRLKSISGLLDKLLHAKEYTEALKTIATLNNNIDDIVRWGKDRDLNRVFGIDEPSAAVGR